MPDDRQGPQDPVNDIPDPDEWRNRDDDAGIYEEPVSPEQRYQTNYAYIQAVHLKRAADALEEIAEAMTYLAYYAKEDNRDKP